MKWKHFLSFTLALILALPVWADNLFVFVPTDVRAKAMQQDISAICPNVTVTVFGRGKDFRKQVKKKPPDAILSLLPVINRSSPFEPVMRGVQQGVTEEEYVLVSVDEPLDITKLGSRKIGVVDLLGRKPMAEFISGLFQSDIKIKRVTKQEDLLPLLTFGSVDGIFVSERLYMQIKNKSNLNLVFTRLNIKVGLVSAALATTAAKENIVGCLKKFSGKLNGILGVDQWRVL
ncbi:MAG: hypothetical protein ACI9FJ_001531 [Alteromonadaceae bacterium]|jgi:hypothetical protein